MVAECTFSESWPAVKNVREAFEKCLALLSHHPYDGAAIWSSYLDFERRVANDPASRRVVMVYHCSNIGFS